MRKLSKILLFVLVTATLVFTFSANVNAIVDADGYEILDGETTPSPTTSPSPKATTSPSPKATTSATPQNTPDTATTPHPQAGTFQGVIYGTISLITLGVVIIAYKMIKKYNY